MALWREGHVEGFKQAEDLGGRQSVEEVQPGPG